MLPMKIITTQIQDFSWGLLALLQIVKVCRRDSVVSGHQCLIPPLCKVHPDLDKLHLEVVQRCVFSVLVLSFKKLRMKFCSYAVAFR